MEEYISMDDLAKAENRILKGFDPTLNRAERSAILDLVEEIAMLPAADVASVVRCKDCVDAPNGDEGDGYAYCHRFCEVVPPTHFCGYGTRKEATT